MLLVICTIGYIREYRAILKPNEDTHLWCVDLDNMAELIGKPGSGQLLETIDVL